MDDQGSPASGSGGGKRPRGRPLKSTADEEESAIRRRARVRKAQQAFQQRRQAATRSLEDRLVAIQNSLEDFSTAFSVFTTQLAQSGVYDSHPALLQQVHGLTEQLLAVAKTASPDSPHDSEAGSHSTPHSMANEPEYPPLSGGLTSGQAVGGSISPGVEHLFLSDADPTPSRESPDEDVHVGCAFIDDIGEHQTLVLDFLFG